MVKKIVSIVLILAMTGSNFSRYLVVASFEINKQFIISNFCENRTIPQLHCNGSCYLMKKLKQTEESEKKQAERNELKNIEVCFLTLFYLPMNYNTQWDSSSAKPSTYYQFGFVRQHITCLFRPPKLIIA
jgi:hypothetical protein